MLNDYIQRALLRSEYKRLEDQTWYADIPGFEGVWANADTVEACRVELAEVLEEWLLFKIHDHDPIPSLEGLEWPLNWQAAA